MAITSGAARRGGQPLINLLVVWLAAVALALSPLLLPYQAFTKLIPGGQLAPGRSTQERTFVFELTPARPTGPGQSFGLRMALPYRLVHFDGQGIGSTTSATRP